MLYMIVCSLIVNEPGLSENAKNRSLNHMRAGRAQARNRPAGYASSTINRLFKT